MNIIELLLYIYKLYSTCSIPWNIFCGLFYRISTSSLSYYIELINILLIMNYSFKDSEGSEDLEDINTFINQSFGIKWADELE